MYQGTLLIIAEIVGAGILAWLAEWFVDWVDEQFKHML